MSHFPGADQFEEILRFVVSMPLGFSAFIESHVASVGENPCVPEELFAWSDAGFDTCRQRLEVGRLRVVVHSV